MSKPRLVDESDLRARAAAGMVDTDLAAFYGVHLKTIQRRRAEWGIPPGSGEGSAYALQRARDASAAAAAKALPRGRGGDAEYERLMRGRSYGAVVTVRRQKIIQGALMS